MDVLSLGKQNLDERPELLDLIVSSYKDFDVGLGNDHIGYISAALGCQIIAFNNTRVQNVKNPVAKKVQDNTPQKKPVISDAEATKLLAQLNVK